MSHFPCPISTRRRAAGLLCALAALLAGPPAAAVSLAVRTLPAVGDDGPVTVFHASDQPERPVVIGPRLTVSLVEGGTVPSGNGRLVVVSHGSGGSPWVHAALARTLVEAGFIVAVPEHQGDNARDHSRPGPDSWALRPAEVSRAIDAVGRDPGLAPLLRLDRVGVYGMSAGGHTALTLAGGRWSPARFRDHCLAHMAEDFPACVGLMMRLGGGVFDGMKLGLARLALRLAFGDGAPRSHHDPRIAAVVAAVPVAADFDPESLARPVVPLALLTAGGDRWLKPAFHAGRVLQACGPCVHMADLPDAGHGAYLSPLPTGLEGLVGELLNDPPGFDRAVLPAIDRRVADFFGLHLLP